jgi:1-acyl-sn-glycerol-3-phosphate acyltransferase
VIRGFLVLLFLPAYAILATLFGYPMARFVFGSPHFLYVLGRFGMRVSLWLAGTRVEFEGLEHLADPRNVVVMPNHTSHLDAPILVGLLGVDVKAVLKRELYRFPLVHYCTRFAGFVDVDRSDPGGAKRAIEQAAASLRAGSCFVIFPEGTRSRTGELGPFKKGAFVAAIEAGSRILPVAIRGAYELLAPGSFRVTPGIVRVKVLDPVPAEGYSYEDRDRLAAEVRGRIKSALEA